MSVGLRPPHFQPTWDRTVAGLVHHDHSSLLQYGELPLLATPTTLIALLRTVAYSSQQQQVTENAQRIAAAGRELFDRIGKFAEHLGKVGDGLRRATDAYNNAVGTWSTRILASGRRLTELGATNPDQSFPELDDVPRAPRSVLGDATEDEAG